MEHWWLRWQQGTHAVNATMANENDKQNWVEQSETGGCVNSPDPGRVSTEEPRQSSRACYYIGRRGAAGWWVVGEVTMGSGRKERRRGGSRKEERWEANRCGGGNDAGWWGKRRLKGKRLASNTHRVMQVQDQWTDEKSPRISKISMIQIVKNLEQHPKVTKHFSFLFFFPFPIVGKLTEESKPILLPFGVNSVVLLTTNLIN